MGNMAIPYMLESALVAHIKSKVTAIATLGITVLDALGADKIQWPAIKVEVSKGREQPENSGNFLCDVDIAVLGRVDPANNTTYAATALEHSIVCGATHLYITRDLTNAISWDDLGIGVGNTNDFEVHNVRFASFDRTIDIGGAVFEDIFTLEVYLHETT